MKPPFFPVLAAEDEVTDQFILKRAFAQAKLPGPLILVSDGQQAIDYLSGVAPYNDRSVHPLPALLFLDLKMPRMTGFDVLSWLAARPEFKALPVIVMTSSAHDLDIRKARELGAREYIVKPHDSSHWIALMREIGVRWMQTPDVAKSS